MATNRSRDITARRTVFQPVVFSTFSADWIPIHCVSVFQTVSILTKSSPRTGSLHVRAYRRRRVAVTNNTFRDADLGIDEAEVRDVLIRDNRPINVKTPYRANPTNALHVAFEANNETRSAAIF